MGKAERMLKRLENGAGQIERLMKQMKDTELDIALTEASANGQLRMKGSLSWHPMVQAVYMLSVRLKPVYIANRTY